MAIEKLNIEQLEALTEAVKQKNYDKAAMLYHQIFCEVEHNLVQGVEIVAQQLHQVLVDFKEEAEILQQTKHELPDASEGLRYVFEETEKASEKTLNAAEALSDELHLLKKEVEDENVQALLNQALKQVNEIIMAQGFQDLTGQVLKRVIVLVADLEKNLKYMIRQAGIDFDMIPNKTEEERQAALEKGKGPNVTSSDKQGAVSGQEDVDDLLADLGI